MSLRRQPGDIVLKIAGAGYSAHAGVGEIAAASPSPCPICADRLCREWPTLLEITEAGTKTGDSWHHVSECEMRDSPLVYLSDRFTPGFPTTKAGRKFLPKK